MAMDNSCALVCVVGGDDLYEPLGMGRAARGIAGVRRFPNAGAGRKVTDADPSATKRALMQRLRYEQGSGIEFAPRRVPQRSAAPAPSPPATPKSAPPPSVEIKVQEAPQPAGAISQSKEERWKNLEPRAMACKQCILHKARKNVVFGTGNRAAELV